MISKRIANGASGRGSNRLRRYRTMGQTLENLVLWDSVHNDLLAT